MPGAYWRKDYDEVYTLLKFLKQGDQHLYTKAMSLVENLADIIKITHDKV